MTTDRLSYISETPNSPYHNLRIKHAIVEYMQPQPTSAHVFGLWGAVVLVSLFDALILRDQTGAVYVAANIFFVLAALALLAHFVGRKSTNAYALVASTTPSARAELTHTFLHVLCVLYVRAAVWFELRALFA